MSTWTSQIKHMFTAMAFAEAGDLDTVKQILQEEDSQPATGADTERTTPPQSAAIPAA